MIETTKRPRGRPRASVVREQAIALAMDNYWRNGLFKLSLSELCRQTGISKPALYREFGGEDGLMAAALEHYRQQVVEPLLAGLDPKLPFSQVLDGAIHHLTLDRGTPTGCLFTKMRLATSHLGPVTKEGIQSLTETQRRAYEAWYQRGLTNGECNPDLTPDFASRYIDTQFATILVQMENGVPVERIREQARLATRPLLAKA